MAAVIPLRDYDFPLPESSIAQTPLEPRDASKLLVVDRETGKLTHDVFRNIGRYLHPGDLLVRNNTRVTALRLRGTKLTGGAVEALLLEELGDGKFLALTKPAKRLPVGTVIYFGTEEATIEQALEDGKRVLAFPNTKGLSKRLQEVGRVPLPPYIQTEIPDAERYQTVYACKGGSAAAPTAGLHFTKELIGTLEEVGVTFAEVTLDVGLDTFRPIQSEDAALHKMHGERYEISPETAKAIRNAKGRIVAVGTTSARTLESAAVGMRQVRTGSRCTSLFITPGYQHLVCDGLLTNFHMPRTTMLLLVASFCGRDTLMKAYEEALANRYRFLSFGDSMLILGGKR